jgi:hypothetical protein
MTRFKIDDFTIRIWREEKSAKQSPASLLSAMSSVLSDIREEILDDVGEIANAVGAVDKDITAVEVLDNEGDGVVLYFQWP